MSLSWLIIIIVSHIIHRVFFFLKGIFMHISHIFPQIICTLPNWALSVCLIVQNPDYM